VNANRNNLSLERGVGRKIEELPSKQGDIQLVKRSEEDVRGVQDFPGGRWVGRESFRCRKTGRLRWGEGGRPWQLKKETRILCLGRGGLGGDAWRRHRLKKSRDRENGTCVSKKKNPKTFRGVFG